jgi:hypothetical protein
MGLHVFCFLLAVTAPVLAPATRGYRNKNFLSRGSIAANEEDTESCADLQNKATHFTVRVDVGTPPQSFDVVADTGSDALIITSCVCVDSGFCPANDTCFRGTDHSSTFVVSEMTDAHNKSNKSGPMGISMTFGSGTVTSIIASDVTSVGGVKARLDDGLLLMVDRRQLMMVGEFHGILGLGPLPNSSADGNVSVVQKAKLPPGTSVYNTKLFMQEASVSRFSMCFNDAGKPGALRMNVPEFKSPLPNIGTFHWGLGLSGISVGSDSAPAIACQSDNMTAGQTSPCGAIPDSGTTLMMGPQDQVEKLFGSLCNNWERCRKARKGVLHNMSASHAFQTMLYHCSSWLTNDTSINEVPSIFLQMGSGAKKQTLEISAWSYIIESMEAEYKHVTKHLWGVIPVIADVPTGRYSKVCSPSFGVQEYNTVANGPVWIMGTPLFYQYTVGYDLSGPSIDFSEQKCSGCNETASLLSSQASLQSKQTRSTARPMRGMAGPPRVKILDTSLPM